MKNNIIKFLSVFNKLLLLTTKGKLILKGIFYRVKIYQDNDNTISFNGGNIKKSIISIKGSGNILECGSINVDRSSITIRGTNNKIIIKDAVELRSATIIIRGSGCSVEIGYNTTFGGVRIINVGKDNKISIGDRCLFSDNIEVWASDTHPVFNEQGEWINRERPVTIGNGVWVGSRVIILKGVEIGEGSIIGMGTLVTKSISAQAVAVGSPGREIFKGVSWELDYPLQ